MAQKTVYGVKGKKRTSRPPSPLKKAKRRTEVKITALFLLSHVCIKSKVVLKKIDVICGLKYDSRHLAYIEKG